MKWMKLLQLALLVSLGVADVTVINVNCSAAFSPGATPVKPNFVGLSLENSASGVAGMVGENGGNTGLAQALRNLAATTPPLGAHPTVIRIGGNSADDNCYSNSTKHTVLPKGCLGSFNDTTIHAQKTFATMTAADFGVRYVIDTNFGTSSDPSVLGAPHIAALTRAEMWPVIVAIEIGNEMDIYAEHDSIPSKTHHRNANWTFDDYLVEFGEFEKAYVAAGMPEGRVQGGTWASDKWYGTELTEYLNKYGDSLATMSLHKYSKTHCDGHIVTQADLLSFSAANGSFSSWSKAVPQLQARKIPFWVGEGNSVSCGGMPGVSDTFTAALWVVDFLPWASKNGAVGMNFHGGPGGTYPPISFESSAPLTPLLRPLYYGLLAFTTLTANHSVWVDAVVVATNTTHNDPLCHHGVSDGHVCCDKSCGVCGGTGCNERPGNSSGCCSGPIINSNKSCADYPAPCVVGDYTPPVITHATLDSNHNIKVLIATKNITATKITNTSVCIDDDVDHFTTSTTASLVRLTAPSISAKLGDGVKWAGQTFDGSTTGLPIGDRVVETVTGVRVSHQTCFDVDMPPLSAALLTVPTVVGVVGVVGV